MGRVARYKKVKKTFDVDNLFQRNDDRDDPVTERAISTREGRANRRNLIVKYGADGKPINPIQKKKRKGEPEKKKGSKEPSFEGRRRDESMFDFHKRLNSEAAHKISKVMQKGTSKKRKSREYRQRKKDAEIQRKLNKEAKRKGQAELDEIERRVYGRKDKEDEGFGIRNSAQAPPEFSSLHELKTGNAKKTNPSSDRARFAKLAGEQHLSSATSAARQLKKRKLGTSAYGHEQLDSMQRRVESSYQDIA